MGTLGFVLPAASIGFGAIMVKPRRGFFPFNDEGEALAPLIAQAVVEEILSDELEITEHPIEQGAAISDHAFKRPSEVVIRCGWSNSPSSAGSLISQAVGIGATLGGGIGQAIGIIASAPQTVDAAQSILKGNDQGQVKAIYDRLLSIQTSRIPFDLLTGKRTYRNMMFKSIRVDTNSETENSLIVVAHCREVLIVSTRVISVPASLQENPQKTNPPQNFGPRSLLTPPNFQIPNIPSLAAKFLP